MLKHWSSEAALSPLAPSWHIPFFETTRDEPHICRALCDVIMGHEAELMQMPAGSDGNTGLGSASLTARFQRYNLLTWDDPEVAGLNDRIRNDYLRFLEALGLPRRRVYIQCWANQLRAGQFVGRHVHTIGPLAYISGNLCLTDSPARTVYNYIYDDAYSLPFPSRAGQLVLFPSYLPHSTTRHTGPDLRFSIAFDLVLPERRRPGRSYLLFDDPSMPSPQD